MSSALSIDAAETAALDLAVRLADAGAGGVLPNPVVGCVLLAPDGTVVGQGHHRFAGGPHAEIEALTQAGHRTAGATAVVTLEPCNHTGRTPPCTAALIAAGVSRVVVAVRDPWPPAAGGVEELQAAGMDVVDLSGLPELSGAARDVNRVWLTATRLQRPFLTWKTGMTIDGRVAAPDGTSRWITSAESRADVHALRSRVDTVLVGVGTVLADDPQLTVRDAEGSAAGRQPLRVVLDSSGRTPKAARVRDGQARTIIATAAEFGAAAGGRVDLSRVLAELYRIGRRHVLLEGGPTLAGAVVDAQLVDEILVYLAPLTLGAGLSALAGGAVGTLADAHRWHLRDVARFGPDVRLRYAAAPPE